MNNCTPRIQPITAEQTYALRHSVLWPDKPLSFVKVDDDDTGYHFGAFCGEVLVAVISLFMGADTIPPVAGSPAAGSPVARFRKFATHPDWQRQGIGTQLLSRVIAEATGRGASLLWCDARLASADFYRKFGMQPEGDVFHKGPIPYTRMSRKL